MTSQRQTAGAHADGTVAAGATTEFEPDVMDLLVRTLRRAVKLELPDVGTDTLLSELVSGDTDAGAAIAPGMRKAGSLSGLICAQAGHGWVSGDEAPDAHEATDAHEAGTGARREADEAEVDAAWREARWRFGSGARGPAPESGRELPAPTGAIRACLLLAIGSARAEGTVSVRCRHVARALLDLPGSRAREALLLARLDLAAAAAALDRLDADARTETEGPESPGVVLLRRAGTLGRSGNPLSRAFTSWIAGGAVNRSPVLFAVSVEALRQAVRCGRARAEPVDLVLGMLALDRALSVAGRSLPEGLADTNAAAALLRRHGGRQLSLVSSASVTPPAALPDGGRVRQSPAVDRAMAVARLSAAEHGAPTVGTNHLLLALLDEPATDTDTGTDTDTDTDTDDGGAVVRLLAAERVDVAALRAELTLRLGA